MRDELVLAVTARRLRTAGLVWRPQVGDWCALIDAVHLAESQAGLWLVVDADAQVGWINVVDAAAQWPQARIAAADALWLPTIGQLKAWLRAGGYHVSTLEGNDPRQPVQSGPSASTPPAWAAGILGAKETPPQVAPLVGHRCVISRADGTVEVQADQMMEVEAVADAMLRLMTRRDRPMPPQGW